MAQRVRTLSEPVRAPQKSHGGCITCKRRKIKCDETRPVCGNCARSRRYKREGKACEFLPPKASSATSMPSMKSDTHHRRLYSSWDEDLALRNALSPTTSYSPSLSDYASSVLSSSDSSDLLGWHQNVGAIDNSAMDLNPDVATLDDAFTNFGWGLDNPILTNQVSNQLPGVMNASSQDASSSTIDSLFSPSEWDLFRHYSTKTCHNMPFSDQPDLVSFWTTSIPQLALRFQCVLDAMLSLAALHIHRSPSQLKTPGVETLFAHYFDQAYQKCQEEAARQTQANTEAVAATSILLQLQLWARKTIGSTDRYNLPGETFRQYRDLRAHLMNAQMWLGEGQVSLFVNQYLLLEVNGGQAAETHSTKRYSDLAALLSGLDKPTPQDGVANDNSAQCLQYLVPIHAALYETASVDHRRLRVMSLSMQPTVGFVELLQRQDPVTMAILARVFTMWQCFTPAWWLQGVCEYELCGIAGLMPPEHAELLRWSPACMDNVLRV